MKLSQPHGRRAFLRGVTAASAVSYSRILGANERVQLGLIGCGARGNQDLRSFFKTNSVDVTALCDVYAVQIDKTREQAPHARAAPSVAVQTGAVSVPEASNEGTKSKDRPHLPATRASRMAS